LNDREHFISKKATVVSAEVAPSSVLINEVNENVGQGAEATFLPQIKELPLFGKKIPRE